MTDTKILTAESVTEGHPDKLCDRIADAVLDDCLSIDKNARVACEVMATNGKIIVAGEITVPHYPDLFHTVCRTVADTGYTDVDYEVEVIVHNQSEDIAGAVDKGGLYIDNKSGRLTDEYAELGAGDQGIMYGYATSETAEMLPLPVVLAHKMTRLLTEARKSGVISGLLPDGKAQVSVEYNPYRPIRATSIIVSAQHTEDKDIEELRREIMEHVVIPAMGKLPFSKKDVLINPSGRFVLGGFEADTGLTGRKLMVDTYGGIVPHGGGALSGKDGTKVDRSGAYMARYIAKNIVAAKLADECTVSVAYAIGKAEPVAVFVDTHETGKYGDYVITEAVKNVFDMTPAGIIRAFGLNRPIFEKTATNGHFTDTSYPWEQINRRDELRIICSDINRERKYA